MVTDRPDLVTTAIADGIARITLNRAEKRNALSPALIRQIQAAFDTVAADAAARVILLRGAGPDFCAGLDLKEMSDSNAGVMDHIASARMLTDLYLAMRRHRCTIIAAIHGRAIGGGAGLATASDLILTTESAQFRYPEVNLGFIAAIVMSMLRRQVGEKRTFEIVGIGEAISAPEALALGLTNHVYPDADFDTKVEQFAQQAAAISPSALTLTKDLLYHIDGMTLESAIHAGLYGNALARLTPDAQRGFDSFVNKKNEPRTK